MEAPEESRAYAYVQPCRRNNDGGTTCTTARADALIDFVRFCGASTIGETAEGEFVASAIAMHRVMHSSFALDRTSHFYSTFVSAINTARVVPAADSVV
jgi:hypothetical protein